MFYYENSSLGPNLLVASTEEEEFVNRRRNRLLRDVGNENSQKSKIGLSNDRPTLFGKD
jgi:hypothetical protein